MSNDIVLVELPEDLKDKTNELVRRDRNKDATIFTQMVKATMADEGATHAILSTLMMTDLTTDQFFRILWSDYGNWLDRYRTFEDEQFNKMLKYNATRQRLERTPGGGLPYLLFNAQRMAGNQGKTVLKQVAKQNRFLQYAHIPSTFSRDAEIIMNLLITTAYAQYDRVEWSVTPEWGNYSLATGLCLISNDTVNHFNWPNCNETWFLKEGDAFGDRSRFYLR